MEGGWWVMSIEFWLHFYEFLYEVQQNFQSFQNKSNFYEIFLSDITYKLPLSTLNKASNHHIPVLIICIDANIKLQPEA
jgi:hypothetical protein